MLYIQSETYVANNCIGAIHELCSWWFAGREEPTYNSESVGSTGTYRLAFSFPLQIIT